MYMLYLYDKNVNNEFLINLRLIIEKKNEFDIYVKNKIFFPFQLFAFISYVITLHHMIVLTAFLFIYRFFKKFWDLWCSIRRQV